MLRGTQEWLRSSSGILKHLIYLARMLVEKVLIHVGKYSAHVTQKLFIFIWQSSIVTANENWIYLNQSLSDSFDENPLLKWKVYQCLKYVFLQKIWSFFFWEIWYFPIEFNSVSYSQEMSPHNNVTEQMYKFFRQKGVVKGITLVEKNIKTKINS